jgi:DNA helicase HerA-like ATPase
MDERALLGILVKALDLTEEELDGAVAISVAPVHGLDDFAAVDMTVRHQATGQAHTGRVIVCNRPIQGGGLKRQIEKVIEAGGSLPPILLRGSEYPIDGRTAVSQLIARIERDGGRRVVVPQRDWEHMLMLQDFSPCALREPGFSDWLKVARPLSGDLDSIRELLVLDSSEMGTEPVPSNVIPLYPRPEADMVGERTVVAAASSSAARAPLPPEDARNRFAIGHQAGAPDEAINLGKGILRRHAAVLGGSGSGKTTLALSIVEQLLLKGVPVVLIDRKGDLCSYANPDVWRDQPGEDPERTQARKDLARAVEVAVFTPGRTSGRPINITLLPNGIGELPEHEQEMLANVSAAAIGEMLYLRRSATHQRQSGILSVALKLLGSRSRSEIRLNDLIHFLEEENEELAALTQRMDATGRARRDLISQLDSLRHRNAALFEGQGEPLSMEGLLGLGHGRGARTRLSVIYTGFLGDNENVLFWVSQFLSEALRFCQRNPSDTLQAMIMFDEADLYIPATSKPPTKEPLESLLKRARSAGVGLMLATQSPGDLDYRSRDQITSWFIGRVREDTALKKLRAAFASDSGLDPARVLPNQTVGEFHLIQEGKVIPMKSRRSLVSADQVPFDRIEQFAADTRKLLGKQLKLDLGV